MQHLKDYITESILSSVGAGLEGMTNDLKKWFIDGCLKSNTLVTDVNIEKVGDRFDIVIPKTEKSLFKKDFLFVWCSWQDLNPQHFGSKPNTLSS